MDYSGARPPFDQVDVVFRYIGDSDACISADEARRILAAGKGIAPNFEQAKDQPLRGAAQGTKDAAYANDHLDALGCPTHVWVWYSCDTAATFDQVAPYYRAVAAAGRRPVAFYGGLQTGLALVNAGIVKGVWCANAASWSGFHSWEAMVADAQANAHVLQFLSHPLVGVEPKAYDYDEIYKPFPTWGGTTGTAEPAKEKDDMKIIPRRQASNIHGRAPYVKFDAATKTLIGFNGADFVAGNGFEVAHAFSVAIATLNVATNGELDFAERPDGSGVYITADGDGGTFLCTYANLKPDPFIQTIPPH
jgi:hypothetical protein